MSGFNIKVKGFRPRLDAKKYTKKVHTDMTRIWREAAKAFVRSVVENSIHVDTGMSAGSLVPLATELRIGGKTKTYISTHRKRVKRKGYAYDKSSYRSLNRGIQLGKNAYKLNFGSVKRVAFVFEFSTLVFQYSFHEPNWNTLQVGRRAFIAELERRYKDYFSKELSNLTALLSGGFNG